MDGNEQHDRLAALEARVAVLAKEVELCVGIDIAAPALDGVTVQRARSSPR